MKLPSANKYPKQFIIDSEVYKIQFVDTILRDKGCMGVCDSETRIIKIKNGQSASETLATLIHELLHAMELEYDIKISHKNVYLLEKALLNLLLQNF